MTLTVEQIAALRLGEPAIDFDLDIGTDCVLVCAAVFSTMRNASGESFMAEELRAMAVLTFDDADSAEPIQP